MADRFARARRAAGAVSVRMAGQVTGGMAYSPIETVGHRLVAGADIVEGGQQGGFGLFIPYDLQDHLYLSRTACALAMTLSWAMRGLVEPSAVSTFARTHASCASASSLVANSDSMGVSLVTDAM